MENKSAVFDSTSKGFGNKKLYVHTPLIESYSLSKNVGCKVYLKLENTQPSDSFKLRGISNLIQKEIKRGCKKLICASGGNAGLSAAYAARHLNMPISIIVPGSTPEFMRERIRGEGAEVMVIGKVWDDANEQAIQLAQNPDVTLIHPFDHPDVWEGHASMMHEVSSDLSVKPDLVVASVGGGGLLCGVVQGMEEVGWRDVPILAMETNGADCFNQAIKARHLVTLPDITSLAKCLGALTICEQAFKYFHERKIISELVTDRETIDACGKFLDDHRMLVEPACGAALAPFYCGLIKKLQDEGKLGTLNTIVIIVCGGHSITMQALKDWQQQVGL